VGEGNVTALRNRSLETMYRPGRVARLVADCSTGLGMIAVGLGLLAYGLIIR
jgi:hypothetical protein